MKIAVLGMYHSGETYTGCLAELGYQIVGIDPNSKVINNLNKAILPLAEPDLGKIIKSNIKKGRLKYTTDFKALSDYSIVWVTVDTPIGAQAKGNLDKIYSYLKLALPHIKQNSFIIVTSQIPAGTSKKIIDYIKTKRKGLKFDYAYIPENLRLGQAVETFMKPSRIVIGTNTNIPSSLNKIFHKLTNKVITVTPASAEMIKHATNAFLATSMSFIYDIADVCEKVGADVTEVSAGLRADERIGEKAYLDASAGFSGGHLDRDLQYLRKIGKQQRISLPVISSVVRKNKNRKEIIFSKCLPHIKTFRGKTITFFGITYKSGTPTLEHSLPLMVAKEALKLGAKINLYDPWVNQDEISKKLPAGKYRYFSDPYESVQGSHAIICITPWAELTELNFSKMAKVMKNPKILLDARNFFLDQSGEITTSRMKYIGVGR